MQGFMVIIAEIKRADRILALQSPKCAEIPGVALREGRWLQLCSCGGDHGRTYPTYLRPRV